MTEWWLPRFGKWGHGRMRVKGAKYVGTQGNETSGGEQTTEYTDVIL